MKTTQPQLIDCRLATAQDAHTLARMSRDYVERGHGWSWQASRILRCIRSSESVVLCATTNPVATHHASLSTSQHTNRPTTRVALDSALNGRANPVAGFAIMDFFEHRAHLSLLAVTPKKRRQGIANALLSWLEETAMVAGIAELTLEVRAQNGGARRFYKKLGFDEFGQIPRYYSGRENAYRLRKKLREPFND